MSASRAVKGVFKSAKPSTTVVLPAGTETGVLLVSRTMPPS